MYIQGVDHALNIKSIKKINSACFVTAEFRYENVGHGVEPKNQLKFDVSYVKLISNV